MTTLPLDLADVLAAEAQATHENFSVRIPFDVEPEEIVDAPGLAERLTSSDEGKRIAALFTAEGRAFLERWHTGTGEEIRRTLAVELTRVLTIPELFKAARTLLHPQTALLFDDTDAFDSDDLLRANRNLLDDVFSNQLQPAMTRRRSAVFNAIHDVAPRSALCLSGGGIRSATFALGILQGLARHGLLQKFDFLSTVSGGGYVGGWLTAWSHRHRDGIDGVARDLAAGTRLRGPAGDEGSAAEEPQPIEHLRTYSNYLTPKLGALSADAWTVFALIGRNLFLNWLLILPLVAVAATLPLFLASLYRGSWARSEWLFAFGVVGLIVTIAYINLERPSTAAKDWPPVAFKWWCLLPLVLAAIAFATHWAARAHVIGRPGWTTPFLGYRLSLLQVLVGLGIFVNVTGWLVWVFTPRWRERPNRFGELVFAIGAGAVGGALTWVVAVKAFPIPRESAESLVLFVCAAVPTFLTVFMLSETLFAGGVSRWTNDEDREWWARAAAWILMVSISWTVAVPIAFYGPVLLMTLPALFTGLGGLSGIASVLIARSEKTAAYAGKVARSRTALNMALAVSGPLFLAILLASVSMGTLELLNHIDLYSALGWKVFKERPPLGPFGVHPIIALATTNRPATIALFAVVAFGISVAVAYFLDINKFSLHSLYRNRLIRAYLGASNKFRQPNRFTGFDEDDNFELAALRDLLYMTRANVLDPKRLIERLRTASDPLDTFLRQQLRAETIAAIDNEAGAQADATIELILDDVNRLSERRNLYQVLPVSGTRRRPPAIERLRLRYLNRAASLNRVLRENRALLYDAYSEVFGPPKAVPKPLHIINTTLNLVGGSRLAWQQRKAEPFSMSALHCGSFRVGYREAADYAVGNAKDGQPHAISLGTAVAISGAAASPNMGYHSSSSATLLMTLFNARLGWWLGNPGAAGGKTFMQSHPQLAIQPLIDEAFGRTTDTNNYVYLSDGGHFENLGLYEAVLRRCHLIVASDASCDGEFKFDDLGNAIRKIRIDLGIPIEFELGLPISSGNTSAYCAVGRVRYGCVDDRARDGVLVYIKPVVYGHMEPRDIINYYTTTGKCFPHESTADQWFSESQFESYRALGSYVVDRICTEGAAGELVDFAESCFKHAYPTTGPAYWLRDLRRVCTIRFADSGCDIVPAEQDELRRLAGVLLRKPAVRVSLVGRRPKPTEEDVAIAQRRAYAVAAELERLGLGASRLEIANGAEWQWNDADDKGDDMHRVDVFVR